MTHLLSPAVPEECDSLTELLLLTVFFQCLITYKKLQYFSHSHYVYVRYLLTPVIFLASLIGVV